MPEHSFEEWIKRAEQDFEYARLGMRQRNKPLFEGVCFHSQQCAEKYLKAFLVRHKIAFPKTHDLIELRRLCLLADPTFDLITDPLKELFPYAIDTRYPGLSLTKEDAKEAVTAMKKIRAFVRARLGLKSK